MDVREKLEVIAHLGDHITYKEDIGICYDSALAKVIEDAYMELKNGVTVQELNGCEYCEEYEDLPEHFFDGKPVGRVFDTCIQTDENGLWHLEVPVGADIGIRFCPMCGRRLPQPPKGE